MSDDPDIRMIQRFVIWLMCCMAAAGGFLLGALAVSTGVTGWAYTAVVVVALAVFGFLIR